MFSQRSIDAKDRFIGCTEKEQKKKNSFNFKMLLFLSVYVVLGGFDLSDLFCGIFLLKSFSMNQF